MSPAEQGIAERHITERRPAIEGLAAVLIFDASQGACPVTPIHARRCRALTSAIFVSDTEGRKAQRISARYEVDRIRILAKAGSQFFIGAGLQDLRKLCIGIQGERSTPWVQGLRSSG
jgi:hypothetical protein